MTYEELEKIFENEDYDTLMDLEVDNALMGLNIIAKYLPKSGVEAAKHDQIFACGVDELLEAGLTEKDAITLAEINWMIDCESLSCFV